MADKEEEHTTTPRGVDWEVVSLTASAYAASPGGNMAEFNPREKGDVVDKDKVETSNPLFMSGHFVMPPQHENLPPEPENTEILDQQVEKDDHTESVKELAAKSDAKEEENWNIRELNQSVQISDPALVPNTPNLPKQTKEDSHGGSDTPYAAWWKKQAASLYAHAKETNTFWSIFVAAAVMGVLVIGRHERWHEWKSRIRDERMRMMAGPISRFKDTIISGYRQDFSIRGSTSRER